VTNEHGSGPETEDVPTGIDQRPGSGPDLGDGRVERDEAIRQQAATPVSLADPATLAARLDEAIAALDRAAIVRLVLAAVTEGLTIERLYAEVIGPALQHVGASWQAGRTAVWEEHLITQAMRTAVEALYPTVAASKAAVKPQRATAVFFCPPEEAHDLGLRMMCDLFDLRGFRTVWVGAMTPVTEMLACAESVDATVVCISASTHFHRAAVHHAVRSLEDALPGVRIVVGGPAFPPGVEDLEEGRWAAYVVHDLDSFMTETSSETGEG
jgi:methanogenic corrinoid protein MtbC1